MKRIILFIFIFALMLTAIGCKKDDTSESDILESDVDTTAENVADTDDIDILVFDDISEEVTTVDESVVEIVGSNTADDINTIEEAGGADGLFDSVGILADWTEDEKKSYAEEMAKEGIIVTYNDDRSTTLQYEDGTTVVQTPDGNFTMVGENGEFGQIGGSWPENEYTKLVSEPQSGTLLTATIDSAGFSAIYSGCDISYALTYADIVKNLGFNLDVVSDDSMYDSGVYSFTGSNKNGDTVSVNYLSEAFVITIVLSK